VTGSPGAQSLKPASHDQCRRTRPRQVLGPPDPRPVNRQVHRTAGVPGSGVLGSAVTIDSDSSAPQIWRIRAFAEPPKAPTRTRRPRRSQPSPDDAGSHVAGVVTRFQDNLARYVPDGRRTRGDQARPKSWIAASRNRPRRGGDQCPPARTTELPSGGKRCHDVAAASEKMPVPQSSGFGRVGLVVGRVAGIDLGGAGAAASSASSASSRSAESVARTQPPCVLERLLVDRGAHPDPIMPLLCHTHAIAVTLTVARPSRGPYEPSRAAFGRGPGCAVSMCRGSNLYFGAGAHSNRAAKPE